MYILLIIISYLQLSGTDAKSAPVAAALCAKWQSTPVIHEASEYVASKGEYYFWQYVEQIIKSRRTLSDQEITHQIIHNVAVQSAINALHIPKTSQHQANLLKFALSIHAFSPRIEMFHQVALNLDPPSCSIFYQVGDKVTCDLYETGEMNNEELATNLLSHDHIFPGKEVNNSKTIIMYADIASSAFIDAHIRMKDAAEKGLIQYVLRHYIRVRPEGKVWLSGYGVELALKSTEYKAVDDSEVKDSGSAGDSDAKDTEIDGFDFATLRKNNPELGDQLTKFRNDLADSSTEMAPMKKWQLQDLSFQAASKIFSSDPKNRLDTLIDVSQNFPQRARSLVKQQINKKMQDEIVVNQRNAFMDMEVDSGSSLLLINGMSIDMETADVFMILDTLQAESDTMNAIAKLGFHGDDLHQLIKLEVESSPENYKLDLRDKSIIWMNDIENDAEYKNFPQSLHELLRPAFPGTIRKIRRNLFHLLFIIDPILPDVKHLLTSAEILWGNDIPIRIGVSFVINNDKTVDGRKDAGVAIYRAYKFALQETSPQDAFRLLVEVYKTLDEGTELTADHVIQIFSREFKEEDYDIIFGTESDYDNNRLLGKEYLKKSGLPTSLNVLFNGELMTEEEIEENSFQNAVVDRLLDATRPIQRAVYMGEMTNSMNVIDYLMNKPGVVPRFNDLILKPSTKFISFQGQELKESKLIQSQDYSELQDVDKTATLEAYLRKHYIAKSDSAMVRPLTLWIVTDVATEHGRLLAYNALKYLKSSSAARLQFIHVTKEEFELNDFINAIETAIASQSVNNARNFITKLMKAENANAIISGSKQISDFYVGGMDIEKFEKIFRNKFATHHIFSERVWATTVLGLKPTQSAVVANGRVVGPLNENNILCVEDFNLLEIVLKASSIGKIQEGLKKLKKQPDNYEKESELIMKLTSALSQTNNGNTQRMEIPSISENHSVIKYDASYPDEPAFDIFAILDPASEEAQKIAPLLSVLRQVVNSNVRIAMNCREKLSDLPVKRFYRYVLEPQMDFSNTYARWNGPVARFNDMPRKALLTMTIHAPEGWLVEAVEAVYDLDNIRLENVKSSVLAGFELNHLLLEGHTTDVQQATHPRGLQFILGTNKNPDIVDTIVMSNLGYFQMKSNPGAWILKLREGRSKEIYEIVGHSSKDSPNQSGDITILMDSFKSKIITVKVSKKPDTMKMDLLAEEESEKDEDSGIWNSIKSTLGGSEKKKSKGFFPEKGSEDDVINIFSLASGHLYERLMRIMFVSVMRKTDAKVKFWILKNYLSPQFKNIIPKMAEEYGFDYELVQYKWPRWLNQQKEKQRTMWGYKILFLDVLFPLNVDKIIFVDADQIVRTDLRELRDLDLEGNPYGYTPFCDDKKEMDGFRFWNQGYWRSHLSGRRYHISAIYVVDLKAFRALAAGDRLRGQYQGLSQDPNSLANLDQDLPNNMIHQVGIKSLPQEWLWCETWCSNESKERAKTIDLCNNPLTKEPKLTAAVRIVPEWTEYDNEIKSFFEKWTEGNNTEKQVDSQQSNKNLGHSEL